MAATMIQIQVIVAVAINNKSVEQEIHAKGKQTL
jgi:hypothetical protein